jgi:hypothetical protein
MNQRSEKQIAEIVEKNCQKHLATLERAGIPRMALVTLLVLTAKGSMGIISVEMKERFRDRRDRAKKLSKVVEDATRDVSIFYGPNNPFEMNLQPGNFPAATLLREHSRQIGDFLRSNGQKAHVDVLVQRILEYKKSFNSWEPLSHVLAVALIAAGIDAKRTEHITSDSLRMKAERYLRGVQLRTKKENDTWPSHQF